MKRAGIAVIVRESRAGTARPHIFNRAATHAHTSRSTLIAAGRAPDGEFDGEDGGEEREI